MPFGIPGLVLSAIIVGAVIAIGILLWSRRAIVASNRGVAWFQKGEFDKAIAEYNESIRLNPKRATTFSSRGAAWDKKGEHDNAVADCSEAIRLDPQNAAAFNNRGSS
jgi:tetratricopeptide (TPR) repeat protein